MCKIPWCDESGNWDYWQQHNLSSTVCTFDPWTTPGLRASTPCTVESPHITSDFPTIHNSLLLAGSPIDNKNSWLAQILYVICIILHSDNKVC